MNRFLKFAVAVAVVGSFVRFQADAAVYRFHLPSKYIEGGTLALGEAADIILLGIGEAQPANLRTMLCDNEGAPLAISGTNGFAACEGGARGRMSLATRELAAVFEDEVPLREIPLVFAVWDAAESTLLGSAPVTVRNNPFADASGSVTSIWGRVNYGTNAVADEAHAIAVQALNAANAAQGAVDALAGATTDATNGLWWAIANLDNATNDLDGRVEGLEGTAVTNTAAITKINNATNDLAGRVYTNELAIATQEYEIQVQERVSATNYALIRALQESVDSLRQSVEPAFTNGTAHGLALSPLDAEAWEGGSLAETPGVYSTTRTNEFGVIIERLLHLVGGVQGIVAHGGPLKASGFTLGTNTVTDWSSLDQSAAVASLNSATGLVWRYAQAIRGDVDKLNGIVINGGNNSLTSRVNRAESDIADLQRDVEDINGTFRRDATNRLHHLENATNALDTLSKTNAWAIGNLQSNLANLAGATADAAGAIEPAFTNGTAHGLALSKLEAEEWEYGPLSAVPGVYYTEQTNDYGVVTNSLLHLAAGQGGSTVDVHGVVADAPLAAPGFTLDGRTVASWDELDQSGGILDNLYLANGEVVLDAGTNVFTLQMDDRAVGGDAKNYIAAYRDGQGRGRLAFQFDGFDFWGDISLGDYSVTADGITATGALTLDGQSISRWSDLTSLLSLSTGGGGASKTWVAGQIETATNAVHGWLADYATADYVDGQIAALSDALDGITIEDGGISVNLTGVTGRLNALESATNAINGSYVHKTGDTMSGTLAAPSFKVGRDLEVDGQWSGAGDAALVQGIRTRATRRGAIAAGRTADATDEFALVWSGDSGIDTSTGAGYGVTHSATGGVPFLLTTNVPATSTLGGFLGTDPDDWEALENVTFVGWDAATDGYSGTYWFEDDGEGGGAWLDWDLTDVTDEEMPPEFFLCPVVFTAKTNYDEDYDFTWYSDMFPLRRYASHGEGTFNANPKGGLAGFFVGDTNLEDAIAGAGVASVNGMGGAVKITNSSPIKVATDTNAAKITVSFDDTYVRSVNGQTGDVTLTAGAGIGFNGSTITNSGVTRISYVSPTAGIGGTYPAYSWSGDVQIGVRDGYFAIKKAEESDDAWHKLFEIGGGGGGAVALTTVGITSASPGRLQVTPTVGGLHTYDFTLSLIGGVDSLNGATGAVRLLKWDGNQLGVTDGAITLPEPPNALRALGGDVLAPVLVVEENSPRITGFEVDEFGDAVITFWGSATTNRLEWLSAEAESEWAPWDMCSWSYSGTTGTVTVVGAEQGAFYRIVVPEGYGTPDRTNVFLVASVPVYLDDPSVPGNRLATLADVQEAVERGGGAAKTPVVTRRAYKDNMSVVPTNGVAWNFANDGVYIADLSVGGWTEESASVTTNEGTVATNTTTVTHPGTMTLNGETIRSWAELATYADGVEFTVETGVESLNGAEGPVRIVAGDNVSIETDTATATITISATGGGGGGGYAGAWTPGSALYTTNDWTMPANANAYAAFGMNTSATNLTLTLSAQSAYQTIVVRKFGAANELNIIGTTTNTLYYDGEVLVLDYWPADAGTEWAGGWYWRRQ